MGSPGRVGHACDRGGDLMRHRKFLLSLVVVPAALLAASVGAAARSTTHDRFGPSRPHHVLIVVMDQMRPEYVDQFDMDNVRRLQRKGVDYRRAYLGHM